MAYGFNDDRSKVEMHPASDVYTKDQLYTKSETYSKSDIDQMVYTKSETYSKTEIDQMDLAADQDLQQEVADRQAGDAALGTRIDNILIGYDDDPNKDSELVDIRTGYDGTVYPTAGYIVRDIDEDLFDLREIVLEEVVDSDENTVHVVSGSRLANSTPVIRVSIPNGTKYKFRLNDSIGAFTNYTLYENTSDNTHTSVGYFAVNQDAVLTATRDVAYFSVYPSSYHLATGDLTVEVTRTVNTSNSIQKRLSSSELELGSVHSQLNNVQHVLGTEIVQQESFEHGSTISEVNAKIFVDIKEDEIVTFRTDDSNSSNSGFQFTLYVWYEGDESKTNLGYVGIEGQDYSFIAENNIYAMTIYQNNLQAGTIMFTVKNKNTDGILQNVEDILSVRNELSETVIKGWKFTIGRTGTGDFLYFPITLNRNSQFTIELIDDDQIIGEALPIYYVFEDDSRLRNGSLSPNIKQIFEIDKKVKGVYFYLGSPNIIAKNETWYIKCVLNGDIDNKVINNETNNYFKVPEYYFENDYLDNKISLIKSEIDAYNGNGDAFIFITDEHWNVNQRKSVALINYIDKFIKIPSLFNGGDTHNAGSSFEFISLVNNAFSGNVYSAVGNHEYLPEATEGEVHRIINLNNQNQIGNPSRHYYYIDNIQQKIRYIVLNPYVPAPNINDGYEQDQVDWFTNIALNVDSGWTILIFTHNLFLITLGQYGDEEGPQIVSWPIYNAIANYDGNGTIAAMIQGHLHRDRIFYIGDNSIPCISTTCDKNGIWEDSYNNPDLDVDRSTGTINEQAFDVIVLNKNTRTIKAIRIGAQAYDGSWLNKGNRAEVRTVTY